MRSSNIDAPRGIGRFGKGPDCQNWPCGKQILPPFGDSLCLSYENAILKPRRFQDFAFPDGVAQHNAVPEQVKSPVARPIVGQGPERARSRIFQAAILRTRPSRNNLGDKCWRCPNCAACCRCSLTSTGPWRRVRPQSPAHRTPCARGSCRSLSHEALALKQRAARHLESVKVLRIAPGSKAQCADKLIGNASGGNARRSIRSKSMPIWNPLELVLAFWSGHLTE